MSVTPSGDGEHNTTNDATTMTSRYLEARCGAYGQSLRLILWLTGTKELRLMTTIVQECFRSEISRSAEDTSVKHKSETTYLAPRHEARPAL